MKYRTLINRIDTALRDYKQEIDGKAKKFDAAKKAVDAECERMAGKWTPDYIDEYKKGHTPAAASYREDVRRARAKAAAVVDYNFDLAEHQLDAYFNAPVSPDFAAKVNSISITGLALSNAEFALLERSARSYLERRLLSRIAESRESAKDGAPQSVEVTRFNGVDLPNIDSTYAALANYKRGVNMVLDAYAGENAELVDALEPDQFGNNTHEVTLSITSGAFFRRDNTTAVLKALEPFDKQDTERTLTERERRLIDVIIDPEDTKKYPTLTPGKVRKIAAENEDLGDLLRLDERYSFYLTEGEE